MKESRATTPDRFIPIFRNREPVGRPLILDENVRSQSYWHHDRRPWLMPGKRKPPNSK